VNLTDFESRRAFCRGIIVRDLVRRSSNQRSEGELGGLLVRYGIPGIAGLDTRRLTRLLRDVGAMPGAFGTASVAELRDAAQREPGTDGVDLVSQVTAPEPYTVGGGPRRIVAVDFGIKHTILRHLARLGSVEVVPASTSAADILARRPDGVFLSNGPGDPAMVGGAVEAVAALIGQVPVFGICLGHQVLGRALGGATFKLPFGHHGGNHPVRHEATGTIEITSQNHNFCLDAESLADRVTVTHTNLNDGTNEGIQVRGEPVFSVQYHPEAGPGPHDSEYLFARFAGMMDDPVAFVEGRAQMWAMPPFEQRPPGLPVAELGVG
jgi:carbamoyl-phosphate synthase small subunit